MTRRDATLRDMTWHDVWSLSQRNKNELICMWDGWDIVKKLLKTFRFEPFLLIFILCAPASTSPKKIKKVEAHQNWVDKMVWNSTDRLVILISTHQEWTLPHVRWLKYCQKTIRIFLGLNPTIEGSYFLLLYRAEPKVSKIQIFSPNWANGSQLSLNRSKWNFPKM